MIQKTIQGYRANVPSVRINHPCELAIRADGDSSGADHSLVRITIRVDCFFLTKDVFVYDGLCLEVFVVAFRKHPSISTLQAGRAANNPSGL